MMCKHPLGCRCLYFWMIFAVVMVSTTTIVAQVSGANFLHCTAPTFANVDLSSVRTDRATLLWTHPTPNDVEFDIEIRPTDVPLSGAPNFTQISGTSFTVSGLVSGQLYHFQVRANCGNATSAWRRGFLTFRTNFENPTRCGSTYLLPDLGNNCPKNGVISTFNMEVQHTGAMLGTDVWVRAVRLKIEHSWRSDLRISLKSPDGTSVLLVDNLNAGDDHLGNLLAPACEGWLELTNSPDALPLAALVEVNHPVGRFLPRQPLANFHNGQNPTGIWELKIEDLRADNCGTFYFAEIVFESATCAAPPTPFLQNVTANSAEISWQNVNNCDSIFFEIGKRGFQPGNRNSIGQGDFLVKLPCSTSPTLTLSNLENFQFYDVFMRKKCSTGMFSTNAAALHFFTDCPPSLLESFDNQPVCDENPQSDCDIEGTWRNLRVGDNFDWKIRQGATPSVPLTGTFTDADLNYSGKFIYFETTNPNSNSGWRDSIAILQSNCLLVDTLVGTPNCHFSFDYFMWRSGTAAVQFPKLQVFISENDAQTWQLLRTFEGIQPKKWQNARLSLANWHGKVVQIRLVATAAANNFNDILIDNLRFYGTSDDLAPDFTYFRDADGDGFGNANISFSSCSSVPPAGWVTDANDCNDSNPAVPAAAEIFCNQIDDDCNPSTFDQLLPEIFAQHDTICAGTALTLHVSAGQPLGTVFWWNAPIGGQVVAQGESFFQQNFTQTTTFYVQDSLLGCASPRTPVRAVALPSPFLTLDNPPAPICFGESFDLATLPILDVSGTTGDWSFHSASPPNAGNILLSSVVAPPFTTPYYIVKTTADGCKGNLSVYLEVKPMPSVQITSGDSTAICRNATQRLTAQATSGSAPYQFIWTSAALPAPLAFQSIDVRGGQPNQVQYFQVEVRDQFGCTARDVIKILTLNSVTSTQITDRQDVTSCGGGDGRVTLTPLNGTAPYTFSWKSEGNIVSQSGSGAIQNLKQGNYRFTVTDATSSGCSMVMPLIVLNAPGLNVRLDTVEHPNCFGMSNGKIELQVSATAPQFLWNNGMTQQNLTQLPAGNYSVTITDGACQQVLSNIELVAPPQIFILENQKYPVACFGEATGSLNVQVLGGSPPFQLNWSNGSTQPFIEQVPAGTYTCQVTDANGCQHSENFIISSPPKLLVDVQVIDTITCFGIKNGSLRAFPSGGAGGYTFNWSNGAKTGLINLLGSGNYQVTVSDRNGCSVSKDFQLFQPDALKIDDVLIENPPCLGPKTGKISPRVTGGTLPLRWIWNTGSTASSLQQLTAGNYAVTVIDRRGCIAQRSNLRLDAPQLLDIRLDSLRQIRCFGEENGQIAISVQGGTAPHTVRWNGFLDDFVLENLFPGQFSAVVEDAIGCRDTAHFQISAPAAPLSNFLVKTKTPTCFGEFNGQIETTTVGGEAPYFFKWNNGKTSEDISELPAGQYQLTVSDARGCSAVLPPVVLEQPELLQTAVQKLDIPCNGQFGQIELLPKGGTPPLHFHWSTGDTTQNIYLLPAGDYAFTLTDADGCENRRDSLRITDTNFDFKVLPVQVKNISCFGKNDGEIVVELQGGSPPFLYSWSGGSVSGNKMSMSPRDTLSNLGKGHYTVFVQESGDCGTISPNFSVEMPPPIVVAPPDVTPNLCKNGTSGCIAVTAEGGTGNLTYSWSNAANFPVICNLSAGQYFYTITDENSCSVGGSAIVTEPQLALKIIPTRILADSCNNCKGMISVQTQHGTPNFWYEWSDGTVGTATNSELCGGEYLVQVTDQNGCTATATFFVDTSDVPLNLQSQIQDVRCADDSTGSIEVMGLGGAGGYIYAWQPPHLFGTSLQNLPGGTYNLQLVDALGCSKFFDLNVFAPPPLNIFNIQSDTTPQGWNLHFDIGGGVPPYFSQIFDEKWQPIASPNALPTGYYHLVVTDSLGCQYIKNWVGVGSVSAGEPSKQLFSMEIFPNPAQDFIFLKLKTPLPVLPAEIQIIDAVGKIWYSKASFFDENFRSQPFDVSSLPAGVYFLMIKMQGVGQVAGGRWIKG